MLFPYKQDKIIIHDIREFEYISDTGVSITKKLNCKDPENKKPSVVDIEFI